MEKDFMVEAQKDALRSKHREQLHLLNELSHKLQNLLTAENLYKETLKIIQSRFHYYYISLWTTAADGTATLQAHEGAYANFLNPGFQLKGEGMIGHVIATKQPYLSNDVSKDRNFTSLKLPIETKSALAVPIVDANKGIVGALNVEAAQADAFDNEDLFVMESIGAQVSLALSNAQLYNKVADFNKELQKTVEEKTDVSGICGAKRVLTKQRKRSKTPSKLSGIIKFHLVHSYQG